MTKGKIKAVLLIVLIFLVLAVSVNLLTDMQATRKGNEPVQSTDPYAGTPAPIDTAPPVQTVPPTPAIAPPLLTMPTQAPSFIPTPTPMPPPTAAPEPIPFPTIEPVQIAVGEIIGSGEVISDTGTPLNLRARWTASVLNEAQVKVTVEVYLDSYQIQIKARQGAVNVSVADSYFTGDCPDIEWDQNVKLETLLTVSEHIINLPVGSSQQLPLTAQYQFDGVYSKKELPLIICGGNIQISR